MIKLQNCISPKTVLFFEGENKQQILQQLVKTAALEGIVENEQEALELVLEREERFSTGISGGIALPHARLDGDGGFHILIGLIKGKGVEWDAIDGKPVHFVFLILGPGSQTVPYLTVLKNLSFALNNDQMKRDLHQATSSIEVINLFK